MSDAVLSDRPRLPGWLDPGAGGEFTCAALDTETSGLDPASDSIIEIGIQLFRFELPSGRITALLDRHSALQDPGFAIPLEIQAVTGITPSMLAGQNIEWSAVDALLGRADLILAHNAAFDRGFVDRKSAVSASKVWACSSSQVDWRGKGFKNARLQEICAALGIGYQAHRALSDVDAMVKLVGLEDVFTGKPYLGEILSSARESGVWIWVEGDTYPHRQILKSNGLRWDGAGKSWGKMVKPADQSAQMELLQALFPSFVIKSRRISAWERFKPL